MIKSVHPNSNKKTSTLTIKLCIILIEVTYAFHDNRPQFATDQNGCWREGRPWNSSGGELLRLQG